MSAPPKLLPEGTVLAGRYAVWAHLGSDGDGQLYSGVDDNGLPAMVVLYARSADAPDDLRRAGGSARDGGAPTRGATVPPLHDAFVAQGQRFVVYELSASGTLADELPAANDEQAGAVLAALAAAVAELADRGAELGRLRPEAVLRCGDGALRYVGPVLPAGQASDGSRRLAELAVAVAPPADVRSDELSELLAQLDSQRLDPGAVAAALGRLLPGTVPRARAGFATATSRGRSSNEDAAGVLRHQGLAGGAPVELDLLVLADGMGGHRGGREAAELAVSAFGSGLLMQAAAALLGGRALRWAHNADVLAALAEAMDAAHDAVSALAEPDEPLPPGSTLVAALRVGRRLFVAHVGDSRAYLWRDGNVSLLTRDHSVVQELVDAGRLSERGAEVHPHAGQLTQALGGGSCCRPSRSVRLLRPGDRVLLVSDGVSNVVREVELRRLLASDAAADALARAVVDAACAAGTDDNATAVVLRLEGDETERS